MGVPLNLRFQLARSPPSPSLVLFVFVAQCINREDRESNVLIKASLTFSEKRYMPTPTPGLPGVVGASD